MSLLDLLPATAGAVTSQPMFVGALATFLAALSGAICAVEHTFVAVAAEWITRTKAPPTAARRGGAQ